MAIDDGDGKIAPYGANGNTTQSATAGPGGKDFVDPTLPPEIGGAGPQAGGTTPYHGAVDADAATSAAPARGNSTMGTEISMAPRRDRDGIAGTEWDSGPKLPSNTDTY
jgi:hypothetical protein